MEKLNLLNEQQSKAIFSNNEKILVLAGPGSGKTHTIVQRLKTNFNSENKNITKGAIVCSFTNNSASDLKNKIEKEKISVEKMFIGTLDAFVFYIINSFKNRWLIFKNREIKLDELVKVIPSQGKFNLNKKLDNEQKKNYCIEWLKEFEKGKYIFAFPSYLIAKNMINDLNILRTFIKGNYASIFIDEVQDLNEFQHEFIKFVSNECSLSVFMVGDENQRLYEWRGATKDLLEKFTKNFQTFYINQNIRSNENIIYVSNKFINIENKIIKCPESRIKVIDDIDSKLLNEANEKGDYLILCDTNLVVGETFNKVKDKINHKLILTKDIDFNEITDNYQELFDDILYFYYNYNNSLPKFIPSFSTYLEKISNYILNNNKSFNKEQKIRLGNVGIDVSSYMKNVISILKVKIDIKKIEKISNFLLSEEYKNKYIKTEYKNKIMTIHASKGLEAESVFVLIDGKNINITQQNKFKYYVAFTRAKENLYIKTINYEILKIIEEHKKLLNN